MFYFAYTPELDLSAFARWTNARSSLLDDWTYLGPAMLLDSDLAFGSLNPATGSGIATVRSLLGKRVAGAIYELPDSCGLEFDRFANAAGPFQESIPVRRMRASGVAIRRGDEQAFRVEYHRDAEDVFSNPLPTFNYIRSLIGFATRLGHSQGWIQHLLSIPTSDKDFGPPMYDI